MMVTILGQPPLPNQATISENQIEQAMELAQKIRARSGLANPAKSDNYEWYTSEEVADVNLPRPAGDRILVRPVPPPEKVGSILISDETRDLLMANCCVGKVVAVGDTAYTDARFKGKPWCKVGDFVTYGRMEGSKMVVNKVKYIILNDDNVLTTLDDPNSVQRI
ncbi:MAG: co-chaperone GroES [Caulobacteraceae bacterium]|nr:co-chaperone GroES [Caulobacteraceae bacterium]